MVSKKAIFKLLLFSVTLFIFSCSTTVAVGESPRSEGRPPGLIIASEKAVENGKKHLRKGKCDKAIHEFNKALAKNPNNFEALYWLGVAEGMCGYYSTSYDRLMLALKYSPNKGWEARVNATIGLVLLLSDRDEDAQIYFGRARMIDPRNELVIKYSEWEPEIKGKGKGKKKKFRREEGFEVVLRWLD
jgi:tetratricopeptide (TPR) repeat protein